MDFDVKTAQNRPHELSESIPNPSKRRTPFRRTPFTGRAKINLAKNEIFTKWVQNRPFDVKLDPGGAK